MDFYGSRNKILYCWRNVPFPFFPGHLAMTSAKTLAHTFKPDRFGTRLHGVWKGYSLGFGNHRRRNPVTAETYRLTRELKRRGAVPLSAIEQRLPAPTAICF